MKQWVMGLTTLALLCAAGGVSAIRAEDEKKKDKVEEGPKPKVDKEGDAVVTPTSWPCPPAYHAAPVYAPAYQGCAPAPSVSYQYVTQYQARSRTVCEYVPVTTTVDVEEWTCVPVKKKVDVEETTYHEKRTKKKGKQMVCKLVERKEKQKVGEYKWVTKNVDVTECVLEPVVRKGSSKVTEYVPVKRKDKMDVVECVPMDRKEVRHYEYCEAFTRKEVRTACTTVNTTVPVTKYATTVIPAPSSPCPPEPCATPMPAQGPQVVCVPYTSYECRQATVVTPYTVDVQDYRRIKKPYEVTIREYKQVKKSVDVEICETKAVTKDVPYEYTEYVQKKITKKVPVQSCELVWTEKDVTVCEYKQVEEPYDYEEVTYEPKTVKKKVDVTEYTTVKKVVKKPCTSWQLVQKTICETVPVQVLVPTASPCPTPAPYYSAPAPSYQGGAVVPGPTCY